MTQHISDRASYRSSRLMRLLVSFGLLMLVNVVAQVGFKQAALQALPLQGDWDWALRVLTQPWIYIALTGYFATFCVWMVLLRDAPIGPAFAASHLDIVLVMALSAVLFDEALTLSKVMGAALIVAGILVLARSESKESEEPDT